MLIGARFVQGVGGALTSAVILGMIVTMFPEPREQAKAIGVYSFVASAGASIGLLAGGALTQAISWHWIFFVNVPIGIATATSRCGSSTGDSGHRASAGRGRARRGARDRRADARRLHDPRGRRPRLGLAAHARPRRRRARAAGRVRRARGPHAQPADAAADLPLAQRVGRERRADADGRRHCSACSSSGSCTCSACSATTRSRPASRSCRSRSDRCALAGVSARLNMRFGARAMLLPGLVLVAAGLRCSRGRRGRRLPRRRPAVDGPARHRRRPSFPALTTLAMSGATPSDAGLASGLINTSPAGRRRARAGRARVAVDVAHRQPARRWRLARVTALTGGYHLAFSVSAARVAAVAVASGCCAPSARRPPPWPSASSSGGEPCSR